MSERAKSVLRGHKRPAVFLDRDGVLNRAFVRNGKPIAPRVAADFRLLPGAADAVKALKRAGYLVVVVTNQPDIGHGLILPQDIEAMHERLNARAPIDAIKVCPHRQDEGCSCRKPRPGMLRQAIREWGIDPKRSFMVGDRSGDMAAGKAVGAQTIFVDRGYAEKLAEIPDARVRSLRAAAKFILKKTRR